MQMRRCRDGHGVDALLSCASNLAPPSVRPTFGNYPVPAKAAAVRFPHAHLVEFPDLGRAPQIQAPELFHKGLPDSEGTPASDSDRASLR